MSPSSDGQTPLWVFGPASLALLLAIAVVVWFLLPAPEARHRFVSPSGAVTLEIGEKCADRACARTATLAPADGGARRACRLPIDEPRPMLPNAYPLWSADEATVDIVYADADGVGGKVTLALADCGAT